MIVIVCKKKIIYTKIENGEKTRDQNEIKTKIVPLNPIQWYFQCE